MELAAPLLDWRTVADDREKYAAYLLSAEWGRLRRIVSDRAHGVCERCRACKISYTHHLTYIRKYAELATDLMGVCEGCHDFIHGRSSDDPAESERSILKRRLDAKPPHEEAIELVRLLTIG